MRALRSRRTTLHTTSAAGLILLALASNSGLVSAEEVTPAAIKAAAEGCVRDACPDGGEVVLEWADLPLLGELEGRDLEIRPRLMRAPDARGPLAVSIEFWKDGQRVDRRAASADLHVYRDVWVAARRIDRNAVIETDDLTIERRDVRLLMGRCFASEVNVVGLRTRRMMAVGDVLSAGDIEKVPVIERGDRVRVTVAVGAVMVTASGVALEDGAEGQVIGVKNDRSGKRLEGTVVARGEVRVDLAGTF